MYKVQRKLKLCKQKFIDWRKRNRENGKEEITSLHKAMEVMQAKGGDRDWERWRQLKFHLDEAYKVAEEFWSRKATLSWSKEGDHNPKYFHAVTAERRKRNRIESLTT